MDNAARTERGALAEFGPIAFAALLGLCVFIAAGHVQSGQLHDAAHEARHAAGLPCH